MKLKEYLVIILMCLFSIYGFSQFKGAHLSSQLLNKELTVTLNVYYDCNYTQEPNFEYVALFERRVAAPPYRLENQELSR